MMSLKNFITYQPQSSLFVCLGHYNMKNTKVNVIELIFEFDIHIYIYVTMINTSTAIHFFGVSPFENRDRGLGLSSSP